MLIFRFKYFTVTVNERSKNAHERPETLKETVMNG